jgi:ankyrin repeat protein
MTAEDELLVAARTGDLERARQLLASNPGIVNTRLPDSEETPLHLAASFGHKDMALLLIQYGASINAEAFYHYTPLSLAKRTGHEEIARLLQEHGGQAYD